MGNCNSRLAITSQSEEDDATIKEPLANISSGLTEDRYVLIRVHQTINLLKHNESGSGGARVRIVHRDEKVELC